MMPPINAAGLGVWLGVGIRTTDGGGTPNANSAEAQQFFDRLLTPPDTATETNYATLIDALVAAGVWAKLDALYIFTAPLEHYCLQNLKSSSYQAQRFNDGALLDWTADIYYSGASAAGIDTKFKPSTAISGGSVYAQNDMCIGVWNGVDVAPNGYEARQWNDPAFVDTFLSLYPNWTGQYCGGCANSVTHSYEGPPTNGSSAGSVHLQRTGANAVEIYRDGAVRSDNLHEMNAASAAPNDYDLIVHPYTFGTRSAWIGKSMTAGEVLALHNAMSAFVTAQAGTNP